MAGLELGDVPVQVLELDRQFRDLVARARRLRLARRAAVGEHVAEAALVVGVLEQVVGQRAREVVVADEAGGVDLQLVEQARGRGKIVGAQGAGAGRREADRPGRDPRAARGVPLADEGALVDAGKTPDPLLVEGAEDLRLLIDPILHATPGYPPGVTNSRRNMGKMTSC
ncbi:MAG: hypothetical protein M0D55_00820 [Elusimicrobiota bacterium]|nr:MAG: hypothetical protein M0D55_00820 [Elusimicrobiota bacterium]